MPWLKAEVNENMQKDEIKCERSYALPCFLVGLVAGVTATLLMAPLSGAATRRLIDRKVRAGENWIRDKAAETQDYVASRGEDLRDRVREVGEVLTRG